MSSVTLNAGSTPATSTNIALWSSWSARKAHNLEVAGSNPAGASKIMNMTNVEFDVLVAKLAEVARDTMNKKGPEYTNQNTDVLNNFKSTGKRLNVSPIKVWSIFMDKQIQSVMAHVNNPHLDKAESIESRFADIINYCFLVHAFFTEKDRGNI